MSRILMVNSHGADRSYGGAERYVAELSAELEARGHEVRILSAFPVRDASAECTVTLHDSDWRDDPTRRLRNHLGDAASVPWPSLRRHIAAARPEVIHTNNLPGIGTGIWEQARRLQIPVVHTLHDYHLLCPRTSLLRRDGSPCRPSPWLCGARTRQMTRWAAGVNVVVGVSRFVLERMSDCFPASVQRRVVQPPLRPLGGDGAPRPLPEVPRRIGYLGALIPEKGIDLLLDAAPALARHGLSVELAGDGPLRERVQASGAVSYHGRLEGAPVGEFLRSCDLGVVPSLWDDPAPLVVREWLAAGRPVLTTRRGGLVVAAALGGLAHFQATAADLQAAVLALGDAARFAALTDSLPRVEDDRDVGRWVEEYEAAYTAAKSGSGR